MSQGSATRATEKETVGRISVALPPDVHAEVNKRAVENNMSLNRTILQLIRSGLEAEQQKKQRLEEALREYRECPDPVQAERLADDIGAMIFGR